MTKQFQTVGLVARRPEPVIAETVQAVCTTLENLGADLVLAEATASELNIACKSYRTCARAELAALCDLIVVVGGDGSLLGVSRDISPAQVPVVGVNRGGLGFLASIAPDALEAEFAAIWSGDYLIEDHFRLAAEVRGERNTALNDVVLHSSRMIEFELWVNDEFVYDQRSDGLIIASPTGSTAYSLSAGGPIMHPNLDAVVIVPMFPHTLTSRPLVVRGDSEIKIKVVHMKEDARLSCDSQVNVPLGINDEIVVRKADTPLKLLYPRGHSFYESCRSKLDWASRLGDRS